MTLPIQTYVLTFLKVNFDQYEIYKLGHHWKIIKLKYLVYINTKRVPLVSLGSTVRATLTCSRYVRLRTPGTSLVVGGGVVVLVVVVGNVVVVVVDVVDVGGCCCVVVVVVVVVVEAVSICPVTKSMLYNYCNWRSVNKWRPSIMVCYHKYSWASIFVNLRNNDSFKDNHRMYKLAANVPINTIFYWVLKFDKY